MKRLQGIAAILLLFAAGPLAGRPYFLAPDGNDRNPGTEERPWATLARAGRSLRPGDQLGLKDGVYRGSLQLNMPTPDGSRFRPPVRIFAVHPGKVTLIPPTQTAAVLVRDGWFLEMAGLVLSGEDGGHWLDIRDSGRIVLRRVSMICPGPRPSRMTNVLTAAMLQCRMECSGTGAPVLEITNSADFLWEQCSFTGPRPGIWLKGSVPRHIFKLCSFEKTGDFFRLQSSRFCDTQFRLCQWKDGFPSRCLLENKDTLFLRCMFYNGLGPGAALRARMAHNTIAGPAPSGELPGHVVNNLFLSGKAALRRGRNLTCRLKKNAPAVDAGSAVTRVRQTVRNSRVLPVDDAGFFTGEGATLRHKPDMIWLGETRKPVNVLAVDRENGVLQLDRAVDADHYMSVTFPFHGPAPDLGCSEVGREYFPEVPGLPHHFRKQLTPLAPWHICPDLFVRPDAPF